MTTLVKPLARSVCPQSIWTRLSRLKGNTVVTFCSIMARHLSIKDRQRLLAQFSKSGTLDFKPEALKLKVDSESEMLRLNSCRKEPETVSWLATRVQPFTVFYDIGANVGAYSLVASVFMKGKGIVYSFEPSFSNYHALNVNVNLNHRNGLIIPLNVALTSSTEILNFRYSNLEPGAALHSLRDVSAAGVDSSALSQLISGYRLDDFINILHLKPPNLMKIDVDGEELSVLKGAERTLQAKSLCSILIECDESNDSANNIVGYLEARGFKIQSKHARQQPYLYNYIFERR